MRIFAIALAALAGCTMGPSGAGETPDQQEVRMGVVEEVRLVPLPGSSGIVGTLGGGAIGGKAGGSVGSGRGGSAASVFGAIAGSVAGNAIESAATAREGLEISVRLDSGRLLLIVQPDGESFKLGERVRVQSGAKGLRVAR